MKNLLMVLVFLCCQYSWADDSWFEFVQPMDDAIAEQAAWSSPHKAAQASDLLLGAMYIAPVVAALDDDKIGKRLLALGVAHGASSGLTKLVKVSADRTRPDRSDTRSFFSGHTSAAFTSAGYLCAMERELCGAGLIGASLTGYLRVAGNKHWSSDVLVGAVVGYLSGRNAPIYVMRF